MVYKKKAAIELSIGTVVIIVLAMSMLILGLILVSTIFETSTDSVREIDREVKNRISEIFSKDKGKKMVLLPDSGLTEIEQGASGEGFALSIRNTETGGGSSRFGYKVEVADSDLQQKCGTNADPIEGSNAWARIDAGRFLNVNSGGVSLAAGRKMENPIHVRFTVSETAPICTFRLKVSVQKEGDSGDYSTDFMDVQVIPK